MDNGAKKQALPAWQSADRLGWLLGGRIWNVPYLLGVVLCWVAGTVAVVLAFVEAFSGESGFAWILLLCALLLYFVLPIPLHVKRLHDVGLSGGWAVLAYMAAMGFWVSWAIFPAIGFWEGFFLFFGAGNGICVITAPMWGGVALGALWPGRRGANRYGPPPAVYARWNVARASRIVLLAIGCVVGVALFVVAVNRVLSW